MTAPLHWGGLLGVWRHVPRGGYGYAVDVPVRVLDSRGARLRVRALLRDGTTREVSVPREHVRLAEPGDNASRWKGL